ncbi:MAG: hypothetical protein A3G76_01220 [Acidobacteria bacterium RIFCSPLOWO2_12_FULL_65_11]|nr:MAG: hypothetical protein A3H95_14975 [Acidobacteria bacterium RIFCSPLOWO2_02_FULL_64_15]OFW32521.1 MAG: hypothetical protein A3G76_01220 [Acidobacteria bacterium RIFCSPLOWO2_12_FULL_65_11]
MAGVLGFFQWLEATELGTALRESTLMFPLVEGTHLLALGVAYHVTIHRRLPEWDRDPVPPARARLAGLLSLLFWAIVITAGRTTAYTMK